MNRCTKESTDTESPKIQVSLILEFSAVKEMSLNVVTPKFYRREIVGLTTGF
jgi:hypothetical protein